MQAEIQPRNLWFAELESATKPGAIRPRVVRHNFGPLHNQKT